MSVFFHQYMHAEPEELEQTYSEMIDRDGYFSFYRFIEDFREGLKTYSDGDIPLYRRKLSRARELFPQPQRHSPSWSAVWDEFERIFSVKNDVLAGIPLANRNGEWQILIDNPYSHQPVVCYPSLPFLEAAYLYGYFNQELKPNEILRLQKITDLLSATGDKSASMLPDA